MGRPRLYTDEERLSGQKKRNKKRDHPETLRRKSEVERIKRVAAGSTIPQDYVDITNNRPMKASKTEQNRLAYKKRKLLVEYKKVFGVKIVDYLTQFDQLQMKNINGNIVPHLTHTAQRMLTTSLIMSTMADPFQLALMLSLLNKQNP